MIECSDQSLYTGISNDVERRYQQHLAQTGAKYFRARKPKALVYLEFAADRSAAAKREIAIKKMMRSKKIQLIGSNTNQLLTLQHQVDE